MNKFIFLLLTVSQLFFPALSPCSTKNVLRIATMGAPSSLDPQKIGGAWESYVIGDLFVGLVTEDEKAMPVPGIAKSWAISPDRKVYTFILRDSLWSDGTPLTAEDFVYSFRRILRDPSDTLYSSLLYAIEGAEEVKTGKAPKEALQVIALDDHTLQIRLTGPVPYFLELLTHQTAYPVPRQVIEKVGDDWSKPENIVTNGPYTVAKWDPDVSITIKKNNRFYDHDNVSIESIVFYTKENREWAQREFQAGNLDIALDFTSSHLPWLKENMPKEARISPHMSTFYYTFNTQKTPFNNKRVRVALAMSINREAIVNILLKTGEIPAYSLVPPGIANYTPVEVSWKKLSYQQRIQTAKRLLKEAGFGPGNPLYINLSCNDNFNNRRICRAVVSMWNLIGVQTSLSYTDVNTHYNKLGKGHFEVARASWIADYNDAQNFLYLMESRTKEYNYGRYSNKKFNQLMKQAQITTDLNERAKIMQRAEAIAMDEMPNIPIYHYASKNLIAQDIKGFSDNPKNIHRWRYISRKKSATQ